MEAIWISDVVLVWLCISDVSLIAYLSLVAPHVVIYLVDYRPW
jgi:hypothetical protein